MDRAPDSIGPTVDVALLADAVQAVRGKLFVLGGGWDTLWVRSFPARHPSMAIGLRLRVPTSGRADVLDLSVELQDADGAPLLSKPLSHQVRLPTQPQAPSPTDFGVVRSFTFNNLLFGERRLLLVRDLGRWGPGLTAPLQCSSQTDRVGLGLRP